MSDRGRRTPPPTHPIPPMESAPGPVGDVPLISEGYSVLEWHPTPDGSGPATAVIFAHHCALLGDPPLKIDVLTRLKSPGELDRLIAVLERHRLSVWPEVADEINEDMTLGHLSQLLLRWEAAMIVRRSEVVTNLKDGPGWVVVLHGVGNVTVEGTARAGPGHAAVLALREYRDRVRKGVP